MGNRPFLGTALPVCSFKPKALKSGQCAAGGSMLDKGIEE